MDVHHYHLTLKFVLIFKMSSQPRRTREEIEDLRRSHRTGYNARHNPPPPAPVQLRPRTKEKLNTKEKIEAVYGKLPTQHFQSNKTKVNERTGKVTTSRIKYVPQGADRATKVSEVYDPVEKYVTDRFKKNGKYKYPPPSTPLVTQTAGSPFYKLDKKRKRGQIKVGYRKKQKRS